MTKRIGVSLLGAVCGAKGDLRARWRRAQAGSPTRRCVLTVGVVVALAQLESRQLYAVGSDAGVTIPFATLDDARSLGQRPEISNVLSIARRFPESQIFLAAYVTTDDVRAWHEGPLEVSDQLVVEVGGYLAARGVEAERISGKGMGVDGSIGRAVVVSFRYRGGAELRLCTRSSHHLVRPTGLAGSPLQLRRPAPRST